MPLPTNFEYVALDKKAIVKLHSLDIAYHGVNRPGDQDFGVLIQKWLEPLARTVERGFEFMWYNTLEDDTHAFPPCVRALAPVLGSLKVTLPDSACHIGALKTVYLISVAHTYFVH